MTQDTLPLQAPTKVTLTDRLAAYFRKRPSLWIDGRELSCVAGAYAWRSRVADIRRPPHSMTIENRQRRVRRIVADGADSAAGAYVISEYRYQPEGR